MTSRNVEGERLGEPLGAKHRADPSSPQPSDATELVERSRAIVTGLSRSPGYAGSIEAACSWIDQAAEAITQAQARATAAEVRLAELTAKVGSNVDASQGPK